MLQAHSGYCCYCESWVQLLSGLLPLFMAVRPLLAPSTITSRYHEYQNCLLLVYTHENVVHLNKVARGVVREAYRDMWRHLLTRNVRRGSLLRNALGTDILKSDLVVGTASIVLLEK